MNVNDEGKLYAPANNNLNEDVSHNYTTLLST